MLKKIIKSFGWRIGLMINMLIKILSGKKGLLKEIFIYLLPSKYFYRFIKKNRDKKLFLKLDDYKNDILDKREVIFNLDIIKIVVKDNRDFFANLRASFFDLIYPYLVGEMIFPFGEGPYESGNVFLKNEDVVIDAGANLGIFSVFAAKKVGTRGRIYAFEPIASITSLLKKTILINGLKNVFVEECALGKDSNLIDFYSGSASGEVASGFFNSRGKIEKVRQITLDEFVEANNLKKINFIKADIEGMERYFIMGAEKTIKTFKPKIAICIYHQKDDCQVLKGLLEKFVPDYKFLATKTKLFAFH